MNSRPYTKLFTRDNGLLVFELWYESEVNHLEKWLGWAPKSYLLHAVEGVTEVYYDPADLEELNRRIAAKLKDTDFLPNLISWYKEALVPLQRAWKERKPLGSTKALVELFDKGALAWSGLAITYLIPNLPEGEASRDQTSAALAARTETENFFDDTDQVFLMTLRALFPSLGTRSRYILADELRRDAIPEEDVLAKREKHFIFYRGTLYTDMTLEMFAHDHDIRLEEETISQSGEIKGQIAMGGTAIGKVRVILKKQDIPQVEEGEILVTTMTTPDYLPAMKRAAAFVTDEGGITSHAAIIAREFKKPCIVGTKIATKFLKTGDTIEVDADKGIVRILER
ncbi:hypothetical protein HY416_03805 [Candidatus Kaiserbacteria bacterium]|nr:hypothetical protein [Candidatus Kaiserbacteria bacterium]